MRSLPKLVIGPLLFALAVYLEVASTTRAAEGDAKKIEFFETRIRPVLVNNCYQCHSAKSSKVKGGLLLDTRGASAKAATAARPLSPATSRAAC